MIKYLKAYFAKLQCHVDPCSCLGLLMIQLILIFYPGMKIQRMDPSPLVAFLQATLLVHLSSNANVGERHIQNKNTSTKHHARWEK